MTATMEVGLVLQGGGALGAYEYGGILCLLDLIDAAVRRGRTIVLRAVTGVSIGAINAACLVGATDREDARKRLSGLWDELSSGIASHLPPSISSNFSLFEVPHFYRMRVDLFTWPTWTFVYDTKALAETLEKHVNFDALNSSKTAFVITAVDVERGELKPFANCETNGAERTRIEPRHVLASGSLAPQFPWTDVAHGNEVHHYWDGGLVDNTPLGYAIDKFSPEADVDRVLVVMNLFPMRAKLPRSLAQVNERVDQLRFGNRLRQDRENADRITELAATIEALHHYVSGALPPDLQQKVDKARKYKKVRTFEISLSPGDGPDDKYGFRDFSREGVEARRKTGNALTLDTLSPVFQ
jgi:NTE family protein